MKQTFNHITKNLKTTIGGLVILSAAAMLWFGKIDSTAFLSILGIAGAWIGLAAKDGTTKPE